MDTAVALVGAYLRLNGYVAIPEEPILIGEGRPYRYHTATDIDILAVRFPRAAVVVPRDSGRAPAWADEDLELGTDPRLDLEDDTVDVLIIEVKEGRPRLNPALRDPAVLLAALRRLDPGFDEPLEHCIQRLIANGEARCRASGKPWRFRLAAFGDGEPQREGGPFTVIPLRHVALFLLDAMVSHRKVWQDVQFGDPVLDLLHLLDKLGLLGKEGVGVAPKPEAGEAAGGAGQAMSAADAGAEA
ncbi:MAG TPA: hypothetical protein VF192_00375 [Longimicrobiales bacterium]